MPEEHFEAFLQADSNGDLRVGKEEIALPSHLIMSDGDEVRENALLAVTVPSIVAASL